MAEIPADELRAQIQELSGKAESARRLAQEVRDGADRQQRELQALTTLTAAAVDATNAALSAATKEAANVESVRTRIAEAMRAIEEDTRKANSESGFAFNAKTNAEEHAKAIAQMRGTVDATFSGLSATRKSIEDIAHAVTAFRASSEADAKSIAELKGNASRDAASVNAALERIEAVMPSIDQGSKDANAITAAKAGVEASVAAIQAFQAQMSELTATATSDGASIARLEAEAKSSATAMAETVNTSKDAFERVLKYESELKTLKGSFEAMQAKLEGLLPHATSAGLASAFHIQKARFAKPQRNWLIVFVAAILALLVAGLWGLPEARDTWDAILRHFVNRLPLVAPLIWLAIYAGHHYNMALRMEEDYAFKEAVSTAFEGYKREMKEIPAGAGSTVSPLVTLCENVLRALSERPGRIYDGRTDVITPITPVVNAAKDIVTGAIGSKEAKQ